MSDIAKLTKLEVARHQLGAATAMFLQDQDPVSVHCLACGAAEIVEALTKASGTESFTDHILIARPDLAEKNRRKLRSVRALYWNAFKHVYRPDQVTLRDDDEILAQFTDTANDGALLLGWGDYAPLAGRLPVAAQVFQVWYLTMHEGHAAPDVGLRPMREQFPDIGGMPRAEQKRLLREKIAWAEQQPALMDDETTDRRPLILRWP